jgi:hypothetical protein
LNTLQLSSAGETMIVTQTRVLIGKEDEFTLWQRRINEACAAFPGFLEQTVVPLILLMKMAVVGGPDRRRSGPHPKGESISDNKALRRLSSGVPLRC